MRPNWKFDGLPARCAAWILALVLTVAGGPAAAQEDPAAGDAVPPAEQVHVTADRLVSEAAARTAEFIGNVRATQGDTVITADRLKIYFESAPGEKTGAAERESIQKIVADGNVNIEMSDGVAAADKAVYITATDVLVLTGPNSKITSERNSVTGDKITIYRSEDRMIVDGSGKERVEAVLYTEEKAMQ